MYCLAADLPAAAAGAGEPPQTPADAQTKRYSAGAALAAHAVRHESRNEWLRVSRSAAVGCPQVGGYLRVLLHGRRQQQMEDMEYYLAVR